MKPRYFLQKIDKNNLHCVQGAKMIEITEGTCI